MDDLLLTPRLALRKPRLEDAEAIFTGYAQDPEVTRFLSWRPHQSLVETQDFLASCLAAWTSGTALAWAITVQGTGVTIGMIELRLKPESSAAGLGFVLAQPWWGKGIATEAGSAVVASAFDRTPDLVEVSAFVHPENLRSIAVLERIHMHRQELVMNAIPLPNLGAGLFDAYRYCRLRTD